MILLPYIVATLFLEMIGEWVFGCTASSAVQWMGSVFCTTTMLALIVIHEKLKKHFVNVREEDIRKRCFEATCGLGAFVVLYIGGLLLVWLMGYNSSGFFSFYGTILILLTIAVLAYTLYGFMLISNVEQPLNEKEKKMFEERQRKNKRVMKVLRHLTEEQMADLLKESDDDPE